jgi:hypothetical protein
VVPGTAVLVMSQACLVDVRGGSDPDVKKTQNGQSLTSS